MFPVAKSVGAKAENPFSSGGSGEAPGSKIQSIGEEKLPLQSLKFRPEGESR